MYPFNYLLPGWSTLAANFKVLNFSGLVQGNIYGKPWCLPFHVLLVNHPSTAIGGQFLSSHRGIHHSSTSIGDGLLLALPHYTYSICFLGGPSTWMGSSHEAFGICWIYLGLFRTSGFECARTSRAKRQTMHSCAVMHFMPISHFLWDPYAKNLRLLALNTLMSGAFWGLTLELTGREPRSCGYPGGINIPCNLKWGAQDGSFQHIRWNLMHLFGLVT